MKRLSLFTAMLALGYSAIAGADEFKFERIPADTPNGQGRTVVGECGGTFDSASARLELEQEEGSTEVKIRIKHARPHTLYTAWLRIAGNRAIQNEAGELSYTSFGGNPITGRPVTALAPSSALTSLHALSPPAGGSAEVANGTWSDANGNARLALDLDFPLVNGAYPFQTLADPALGTYPVAIVIPDGVQIKAPFTIRVISHCLDDLGHGLVPGVHESWFDTILQSKAS